MNRGPKVAQEDKYARFVASYLISLNATQAASEAGYSKRSARQIGARLTSKASVRAAIKAGQQRLAIKTGITAERVLLELEALAFSRHNHYVQLADGTLGLAPGAPEHAHAAVASVKRRVTTVGGDDAIREVVVDEFRLWPKEGPLTLAGRHVGLKGFVPEDKGNSQTVIVVPDSIAAMSAGAAMLAIMGAGRDPEEGK